MKPQAARHQLPASDETSVTTKPDLAVRWQELFGSPAPHPSALIAQAIAWKEQANAEGDVPKQILRDLRILAHQVSEARRHPNGDGRNARKSLSIGALRPISDETESSATHHQSVDPGSKTPTTLLPASSQLAAGNRLVKHYGGETHVVEVTPDGMIYRDKTYATLSAVAKVITGTHWNGLLFFGLRRRKTYARKKNG